MFHIQQQFEQVANGLVRHVQSSETRLLKQAQQMSKASLKEIARQRQITRQFQSQRQARALLALAEDVKTLLSWFSHDVLALAGRSLAVRQERFDFIVSELQ